MRAPPPPARSADARAGTPVLREPSPQVSHRTPETGLPLTPRYPPRHSTTLVTYGPHATSSPLMPHCRTPNIPRWSPSPLSRVNSTPSNSSPLSLCPLTAGSSHTRSATLPPADPLTPQPAGGQDGLGSHHHGDSQPARDPGQSAGTQPCVPGSWARAGVGGSANSRPGALPPPLLHPTSPPTTQCLV
ncbi:proline-rich receptor-like protein kinase PERK2 [Camelus ferus]|uniref:Proline-rich receptor-like protein kinase PERK2 n=1 Tax=Camelus ferus TaxID=419612 RepID=A0A8B8SK45_CAMFR|nr:proline-rich receptor-like protein kinase PERK2 [Camelus ferus]